MDNIRVLFICGLNSGRSQMAEVFLNDYDYVITVCDETAAGQCPVFPGITKRFHWPFMDPEALTGNHAEKLAALREIREQIRQKVSDWVKTVL